jgi:predicted small integral membrane protein
MNVLRLCKSAICFSLSIFALLVGVDNVIEYNTNFVFVQHTLSMDTVFRGNTLISRAINNPLIWNITYCLIIFGELLTGALLMIGSFALFKNFRNCLAFHHQKQWAYLGCTVGFLVWFLGFMVIRGEWFDMWQSENWNGVPSAFRFVVMIFLTLIFIAMPEADNRSQ